MAVAHALVGGAGGGRGLTSIGAWGIQVRTERWRDARACAGEVSVGKRIAYFADGTWDNSANDTNVHRLWAATLKTAEQMPMYDTGVGADGRPIEHLIGGAMGTGLYQKIKDGYTQIAQVYEAGDELFLFGFSRGAYTARSLAGMIAVCGLPTGGFDQALVEQAFQAYRNKPLRAGILAGLGKYALEDASITMLGVWDTVGSLGIPSVLGFVEPVVYGFLDTALHPDVKHAYHALAIDERRQEFPPTIWTSAPAEGQTLEQVWFSGCHSDVGGGCVPDAADGGTLLSDVTLGWMMGKASALGLEMDADVMAAYAPLPERRALNAIHESWTPLALLPKLRAIGGDALIANSVALRVTGVEGYRPKNLQTDGGGLATSYGVTDVVEVGQG